MRVATLLLKLMNNSSRLKNKIISGRSGTVLGDLILIIIWIFRTLFLYLLVSFSSDSRRYIKDSRLSV